MRRGECAKEPSGETGRDAQARWEPQRDWLPSGSGSKVPLPFDPESLAEKNKDFGLECMVSTYHRLYALFSLLFLSEEKKPIVLSPPGRWKASSALFHQLTAFLRLTTSTEIILFNWGHLAKSWTTDRESSREGRGLQQLLELHPKFSGLGQVWAMHLSW